VFKKDGNRVEDPEEVNCEMVSFFQKLLGVNSNFVELNEERLNAAISVLEYFIFSILCLPYLSYYGLFPTLITLGFLGHYS
jgi:hypothetical protein